VPLSPGDDLLHYRLIEQIGAGGMGVVWRALDTTLDREVAIKVLPDQFSAEAERLARFEREARVLASLNHPHIAGIYGIHEAAGQRFLSMELVPGEDLSALLQRGPLPQERVFRIAREIAEALEAAHENGIVHRDLKPANVRLTHDGSAKVLDFGLAKAHAAGTASDPMRSATVTSAGTVAGLILGTAAYMSPEQASGQPTDRRADIWSFGVLLHEMLSGQRMFDGETISHTLADVLRKPIELDDLPASTPPRMRRLLERCLERDPRRRLRDIGEARIAIEDVLADPRAGFADATTAAPASTRRRPWPWLVAGVALVVAAAALIFGRGDATNPAPTQRLMFSVSNVGNARQGDGRVLAIAPDGTYVVMRGGSGAEDTLLRRDLNEFTTRPIEGTIGGSVPFFSPDGRWIGFTKTNKLEKVRSSGGPAIELGPARPSPTGYAWGDDGFIYFGAQGRIWRIPEDGGASEALTERSTGDGGAAYPFPLRGGRTLLCSVGGFRGSRLAALDLASKQLKDLDVAGSNPRYLASGHVLFSQGESVYVAPFDRSRLEFTGPPVAVLPRVWIDQSEMQLDVAANGTVAYLPSSQENKQTPVTVDLDGREQPLLPDGLPFQTINDPRLSHDGHKLALAAETEAIWVVDLDTQTPTLISESGFYPHWSPDDSSLAYGSTRGDSFDIYVRRVDLSGPEKLVLDVDNNLRLGDWTPQGTLIIREEIPNKGMDLRTVTDLDHPEMVPLLEGADDELAPTVSRDGKWLAFVSDYSGADEIYVTTFPVPGPRVQVSIRGGTSPVWAPDGSAIHYFEDRSLIRVSIETAPHFRVTGRTKLFEGDYVRYRWSRQYDVAPDGSYFVLVRNPPRGVVEVVTNWFEELKKPNQ